MEKPTSGKAGSASDGREHRSAPADRPWPPGDCRVCGWRTPWVPDWCWRHTRRMRDLGYAMPERRAA